ncbi:MULTISPECIES: YdcH family protein [unclassified Rhizobium]|uniref:YdcH family protein n=1 Tax=unclassified Rhizobium TaxID=2613769 RepID=UPI00135995CD|nr:MULTISPECIES: DUF465 domain-containing protein [unclassified Rhizobium]
MSNTPHRLADEFPERLALLRRLREEDRHFSRQCEEYETINDKIHLAETDIQPVDDLHMTEMRKSRMLLKDAIFQTLARQQAAE